MKYSHETQQISIFNFNNILHAQVDLNHELVFLEKQVLWDKLVDLVSSAYSNKGRNSCSIRMMLGLLILKHKYRMSDEDVVERLKGDIYFQYFCGYSTFIDLDDIPDPSLLTYFRRRINEANLLSQIENLIALNLVKKLPKKKDIQILPIQPAYQLILLFLLIQNYFILYMTNWLVT